MLRSLYYLLVAVLFILLMAILNIDFYSEKDIKNNENLVQKKEFSVLKVEIQKNVVKLRLDNAIKKVTELMEDKVTDIEAIVLFNETLQFYLDKRTNNWWWVDDCLYSDKTIRKFRKLAEDRMFKTRMSEAGFLVIERQKDENREFYPLPEKIPVPQM